MTVFNTKQAFKSNPLVDKFDAEGDVYAVCDGKMVHYVACTRARKKNIGYTLYGKEGLFVGEMDLVFENPQKITGSLGVKPETKELSEDERNLLEVMETL